MAEKTFYIGAIPDYNKEELKKAFDDFASYLTDKLGFTVQFKAHDNYIALVDDFANDEVQMAWFCGVTFA